MKNFEEKKKTNFIYLSSILSCSKFRAEFKEGSEKVGGGEGMMTLLLSLLLLASVRMRVVFTDVRAGSAILDHRIGWLVGVRVG